MKKILILLGGCLLFLEVGMSAEVLNTSSGDLRLNLEKPKAQRHSEDCSPIQNPSDEDFQDTKKGVSSAPVSPVKMDVTVPQQAFTAPTSPVKMEQVETIRREIFKEESFQSEYGVLTLKPVVVECVEDIPEWLQTDLEDVSRLSQEGNWERVYTRLDAIYDRPQQDYPQSFGESLDSMYVVTCLHLFESTAKKEYNQCNTFCTWDGIKDLFEFGYKGTTSTLQFDRSILSTTGVYLYALSRYLGGSTNFEEFSLPYKGIIGNLKKNGVPQGNYVSWALKMASEDETTRKIVEEWKLRPSL